VQGRLSIHEHHVSIHEVAPYLLRVWRQHRLGRGGGCIAELAPCLYWGVIRRQASNETFGMSPALGICESSKVDDNSV